MHIPTNSLRDSVSQNSWLNRQCFALKDNIFPPQSSQRQFLPTRLESSVYKYEQHTLPKLIPHLLALEAAQIRSTTLASQSQGKVFKMSLEKDNKEHRKMSDNLDEKYKDSNVWNKVITLSIRSF